MPYGVSTEVETGKPEPEGSCLSAGLQLERDCGRILDQRCEALATEEILELARLECAVTNLSTILPPGRSTRAAAGTFRVSPVSNPACGILDAAH